MHAKSDNREIMISDEADEVIEELFHSLKNRHQNNLETKMRNSAILFDFVHWLYYKCHRINFNCDGSYIDFFDWIKNKKTTINSISKKYNNHCDSGVKLWRNNKDPKRITKIKPFLNKYDWEGMHFPSEKDNWKTIEKK